MCDDGDMSPSPRRLTFTVGTSLLTASLATAACAKPPIVNTRPDEPLEIVNEGPATDPEEPTEEPAAEQPAEQPAAADSPEGVEEPRTVNTRQADPK